jgi:hypothetical protein
MAAIRTRACSLLQRRREVTVATGETWTRDQGSSTMMKMPAGD